MLCAGNSVIELYDSADEALPQGTIRHVALSTPDVDEYIAAVRAAGYPVTVEPKDVTLDSVPPLPHPHRLLPGAAGGGNRVLL